MSLAFCALDLRFWLEGPMVAMGWEWANELEPPLIADGGWIFQGESWTETAFSQAQWVAFVDAVALDR